MADPRQIESQLIALYAAHTVDAVRNEPALMERAFATTIGALVGDQQFALLKEYIESQKRYIEPHIPRLEIPDSRQQVAECLRILLPAALFPNGEPAVFERRMQTFGKLLVAMYGSRWSATQRGHFDYMLASLVTWKSYFLSYTNHGARVSNERYKRVIRRESPKLWKRRDWDNDNILPDVIFNSLFVRNVQRGFFDKKSLGVGDDLMSKLTPEIDNAFAFIQLIHADSFTRREDNYSYAEWKLFHDSSVRKLAARDYFATVFANRFAPILTAERDSVYPDPVPEGYDAWRDAIFKEKVHIPLPVEPEEFDATMLALKARIIHVQEEILTTVPA